MIIYVPVQHICKEQIYLRACRILTDCWIDNAPTNSDLRCESALSLNVSFKPKSNFAAAWLTDLRFLLHSFFVGQLYLVSFLSSCSTNCFWLKISLWLAIETFISICFISLTKSFSFCFWEAGPIGNFGEFFLFLYFFRFCLFLFTHFTWKKLWWKFFVRLVFPKLS